MCETFAQTFAQTFTQTFAPTVGGTMKLARDYSLAANLGPAKLG